MADKNIAKSLRATKRRRRVRGKVRGTTQRPRLTVTKSLHHVYAQIIDDLSHKTLVGIGSGSKEMVVKFEDKDTKTDKSRKVGQAIAEKAQEQGIKQVVFDRNQYRYHGRVKAVGEGAREKGLEF